LGQIKAVREVLSEIPGIDKVPEWLVLNKADVADPEAIASISRQEPRVIAVSAHTGQGIPQLKQLIAENLPRPDVPVDVVVPYCRGDLVSRVFDDGDVDFSEHLAEGTRLVGRVKPSLASELKPYTQSVVG
jgi:GTP-binding protein HflX